MIPKPQPTEYPAYMQKYLDQLPEGEVLHQLEEQIGTLYVLMQNLTESEAETAYAPGKWTIKELLNHLTDTERILSYRALCIARGEKQALPGFEEDDYVKNSLANQRSLQSLLEEHELVRKSTLALFKSFETEVYSYLGNANGNPVSVRAMAYLIAAHEQHHIAILKSRYLVKPEATL